MPKYNVELKYTAYIMYEVDADNITDAEDKAWEMLNDDADHNGKSVDWEINSVERK